MRVRLHIKVDDHQATVTYDIDTKDRDLAIARAAARCEHCHAGTVTIKKAETPDDQE